MDSAIFWQFLRASWLICIIVISLLFLFFAVPLVYPFILGWLFAYAMNPLVNVLQRKAKLPRWLASLISLLLYLGVFVTVLVLLISRIVVEISKLAHFVNQNINRWVEEAVAFLESEWVQGFLDQIALFSTQNEKLYETIEGNLISAGERLSSELTGRFTEFVNGLIGFAASLPNFALILVVVLLAAFFISKDWYKLIDRLTPLLPDTIRKTTYNIWKDLQRALFGYLRAQLIMISITALFVIVGLLVLRVEYAVTIGLLIGLVDLLPYLGTGAAMIPWAVYLFVQGNYSLGIGVSILYAIVLVARSMIEPKVLATSIGLNALSTLIAMVVGLKLFGVVGVIIGPVTLVIAMALHRAHVFRDIKTYILNGRKASS